MFIASTCPKTQAPEERHGLVREARLIVAYFKRYTSVMCYIKRLYPEESGIAEGTDAFQM